MKPIAVDEALLGKAAQAVEQADRHLLSRFRTNRAPTTMVDLLAGIEANDVDVEAGLRDALQATLPGSQCSADEKEEARCSTATGGSPTRPRATSITFMAVRAGVSPRRWCETASWC